jgi:hypothetical protein
MREEKTTTQEIQALERKFEAWSQMTEPAVVRKPQQKPLASARDITKDLPKEVAQFEVYSNIYTLIVVLQVHPCISLRALFWRTNYVVHK